MSIIDTIMGMPNSSSRPLESMGLPSTTSDTSRLVPPMSYAIKLSKPLSPAIFVAAITPAAGPDRTVFTERVPAASTDIMPPFDCMMSRSL